MKTRIQDFIEGLQKGTPKFKVGEQVNFRPTIGSWKRAAITAVYWDKSLGEFRYEIEINPEDLTDGFNHSQKNWSSRSLYKRG